MRNVKSHPDEAQELTIRRAQQGDLAAFNALVLAYQAQAYNVAYRILGELDAADATQDSFLKAYRNLRQFRGGSFRAWLLRIVVNTCYDQLRARKRRPSSALEEAEAGAEHDGRLQAHDESPEAFVLRRELGARLQAALTQLPDDQRVVVVLRDVEGLAYEEIARSTGMQAGTVKSRLSRGRARLRDLWGLAERWRAGAHTRMRTPAGCCRQSRIGRPGASSKGSPGQRETDNEPGGCRVRELATLERVPAG